MARDSDERATEMEGWLDVRLVTTDWLVNQAQLQLSFAATSSMNTSLAIPDAIFEEILHSLWFISSYCAKLRYRGVSDNLL
jgi:hypothetical protein